MRSHHLDAAILFRVLLVYKCKVSHEKVTYVIYCFILLHQTQAMIDVPFSASLEPSLKELHRLYLCFLSLSPEAVL